MDLFAVLGVIIYSRWAPTHRAQKVAVSGHAYMRAGDPQPDPRIVRLLLRDYLLRRGYPASAVRAAVAAVLGPRPEPLPPPEDVPPEA